MRISKNAFSKKVSDGYVEFIYQISIFYVKYQPNARWFWLRYPTYGKRIGIRSELY